MKIHLIACGGAVMHNFAIALHKKGYVVSGSDDEIFDPAKSRLLQHGLLPDKWGWFPEKITEEIDVIILGMHARKDNPELIKALEFGIKVYSFPEYIYEQSKDKTRIVIGGSHGKTTTTSMILHVLKTTGRNFDYMVGAQIEGFDTMVKLTEDAPVIVLEGDEYLSSPIDLRPKFHWYKPHIAVLTGIAWDHINVFPTFEIYVKQFEIFTEIIENGGTLIYCQHDSALQNIATKTKKTVETIPYATAQHEIKEGITYLHYNKIQYPVGIFGDHNLMNLSAAFEVCKKIGISDREFFEAITSFKGASKRLELVAKSDNTFFYKDFAHSPSKLKATTEAVKKQFPDKKVVACMELHTFSSLNTEFLKEYKGAMDAAEIAIVYYNPHTIEHKKLLPITSEEVIEAFGRNDLIVMNSSDALLHDLHSRNWNNAVLLMMSSGNFDGIDYKELAGKVVG